MVNEIVIKLKDYVKNNSCKVIGILGGGQLARMLCLKAHELGLEVKVLSEQIADPAAQVTQNWIQGSPQNLNHVEEFCKEIDVLTFESEFVAKNILAFLDKQKRCSVFPSSAIMAQLQDKLFQKQLLLEHNLPTSSFQAVQSADEFIKYMKLKNAPQVLKTRTNGYDGKGVYIFKKADKALAKKLFAQNETEFLVEDFVPFKRELAISITRSTSGELVFFPLVETKQEEHRCLWVKGPVQHNELSKLKTKLKIFLNKIDYVGFITFELFDTGKKLLINEIAPRVHNSCHYSLGGLTEDQFSIHLKSILGLKFTTPKPLTGGFAMYNLIGSNEKTPNWDLYDGVNLHWYGKTQNRKGRKMGHLTSLGSSPGVALKKLLKAKEGFRL